MIRAPNFTHPYNSFCSALSSSFSAGHSDSINSKIPQCLGSGISTALNLPHYTGTATMTKRPARN
jgi:hypothetical protein